MTSHSSPGSGSHRPPGGGGGERGIILVVVLWTIASLALLVFAFNSSVRSGVEVLASEIGEARDRSVLEAGLEVAAAHLITSDEKARWKTDATPYRVTFGGRALAITIQDTANFIDLNKADDALLLGLLNQFVASGARAEQLRDRILDWRDKDHVAKFRGAEDDQYEMSRKRYGAGDRDFQDVSQLKDVLGFDTATYRKVAPFLTVYGMSGRIKEKGAAPEVLRAMPLAHNAFLGVAGAAAATPGDGGAAAGAGAQTGSRKAGDAGGTAQPAKAARGAKGAARQAYIVRVGLLGGDARPGATLEAAILPAADEQAPYRVLSWKVS